MIARTFDLLAGAVLFVALQLSHASLSEQRAAIRQLHLRRRHPKWARGGLQKKDHLKDFRVPSPSQQPITAVSTNLPTTMSPSDLPSIYPSNDPTIFPTHQPTKQPTTSSSQYPSHVPTRLPTQAPTTRPSEIGFPLCERIESPPLGSSDSTIFGRIGNGLRPSTCDLFFGYRGSVGNAERYYEQIGPFVNPSSEASCIKVYVDRGSCVSDTGETVVHIAAFSQFNPSDISQGYLGDVGDRDNTVFQFAVAGHGKFYVVAQQIRALFNPDNGDGCVFSVVVQRDGERCGLTSRPTAELTEAPSVSPMLTMVPTSARPQVCESVAFPPLGSSGSTMIGRIVGDSFNPVFFPTSCDSGTTGFYPGSFGDLIRFYEAIGPFRNPSPESTCVKITIDQGTCVSSNTGNTLAHVTAFQLFDPSDITANFLGAVNDPNNYSEFGFEVPGNGIFYLVSQQIRSLLAPDNGEGCALSVVVEIGEGTCEQGTASPSMSMTEFPTLSPTVVPSCAQILSPPLGSSGTTTLGHYPFGIFGESTCAFSNIYRGEMSATERYFESIGPFRTPSSDSSCVKVTVDRGDCVDEQQNTLVHLAAYTQFNSSDISQGYLGDMVDADSLFNLRFVAPPDQRFYVVGHQVRSIEDDDNGEGCVFSVTVEFGLGSCDRRDQS